MDPVRTDNTRETRTMTLLSDQLHLHPEQLDAYWMPFTANRHFKSAPRMLARAEGMHFWTDDGRQVLDAVSGLWCCNAGHNRAPIVEAIQKQAGVLDFAPPFQMAHPLAFELANRIAALAPEGLDHVFYCNSGSEAVATGSTITAAIVEASCSATSRSSSSARCSPCFGMPRENAFRDRSKVCGRWSTPASMAPNILRLATMPPTEMPPKLTPW